MTEDPVHPIPRGARIYLAGHDGMVGSAILAALLLRGYGAVVVRKHHELDLRDQAAVDRFFDQERPEYVFLAAGKVGGILANTTYPAEFLYDNLAIASNVIDSAHRVGVTKLLNLGSSCIYPRLAPQPISEEALLTGPLEETNRAYAVAKIAAIELCDHYRTQYGCDFISAMPTNLFGPGDNFDLETSHVMPAMIRKAEDARLAGHPTISLWGTGSPRREFLYVDDLAEALLFLMEHFSEPGPINVGSGEDLTIRELAELVSDVVGFEGSIEWDTGKPDGIPRKLLDVSRLRALGYRPATSLREGLQRTIAWYRDTAREQLRLGDS